MDLSCKKKRELRGEGKGTEADGRVDESENELVSSCSSVEKRFLALVK